MVVELTSSCSPWARKATLGHLTFSPSPLPLSLHLHIFPYTCAYIYFICICMHNIYPHLHIVDIYIYMYIHIEAEGSQPPKKNQQNLCSLFKPGLRSHVLFIHSADFTLGRVSTLILILSSEVLTQTQGSRVYMVSRCKKCQRICRSPKALQVEEKKY